MFKWQTTTILSGATVDNTDKGNFTDENGLLVSKNEDPTKAYLADDFENAKFVLKEDQFLQITRLGVFRKGNVTKIFRRDPVIGKAGQAILECDVCTDIYSYYENPAVAGDKPEGIYRLNLDIRLGMGSQNSNFANVWVFKGKPLAYEFELKKSAKTKDGEAIAKGLADAINKENRRFGSKFVKAEVDGSTLTITPVGPDACYQYFTKAELQKYDSLRNSALIGGEYETFVEASVEEETLIPCQYPFGTYFEIIKDLRLPTQEATQWSAIIPDERPAVGVNYAQFMIYMCVDRGIMGGDAVGETTQSVTAHSIWVPVSAADKFQELLEAGTGISVEWHDADYKKAAGEFTDAEGNAWTDEPWNGDTTQESENASTDDQDGFNAKAGEAKAHKNVTKTIRTNGVEPEDKLSK